jgi:hypothetical protein
MNQQQAAVGDTSRKKLFQTNFHIDLVDLEPMLSDQGLVLNRAHRKGNNGLGNTEQIMLVYEKDKEEVSKSERRALLDIFTGDGKKIKGFDWKVTAYQNSAIARVPAHIYMMCGTARVASPKSSRLDLKHDDFVLRSYNSDKKKTSLTALTRGGVFAGTRMVRVSFNVYGPLVDLIPDWIEVRERHAE